MTDRIVSTDYHDYVIKDGHLIGDFEGMYKHSKEIPWHQDLADKCIHSRLFLELISQHRPYNTVCEIGCGLGYFTEMVYHNLKPAIVTGFDISPTAINSAKDRTKNRGCEISFKQMDITKECFGKYDCVILKDIMWYIYPNLHKVLDNLTTMLSKGGFIFVEQAFPPNKDYVGKETIESPDHLRDIFSARFELVFFGVMRAKESNFESVAYLVLINKNSIFSKGET